MFGAAARELICFDIEPNRGSTHSPTAQLFNPDDPVNQEPEIGRYICIEEILIDSCGTISSLEEFLTPDNITQNLPPTTSCANS